MSSSPRLALPYLAPSQAQKHVTHNEAVRVLDALVHLRLRGFGAVTPPGSPSSGDAWDVGPGAAGAWSGQAGRVALWDGSGWTFHDPREGWRAWDSDADLLMVRRDGAWVPLPVNLQNVDGLGIQTASDAVNRLAVRSPATLLTHEGAGHQLKLNKAASAETASLLFQSDWTGYAEMGLAGTNDFSVKVSSGGGAWNDALAIARATGRVSFPNGAGQAQVDVIAASGSWTMPAWAREVTVVAIGAGGGGGAGARRAAGAARTGGGGGGAGGIAVETYLASELAPTLGLSIGAPGAGAAAVGSDTANGGGGGAGGNTSVTSGGAMILVGFGGAGGGGGGTGSAAGGTGGQGLGDFAFGAGAASSSSGGAGGAAAHSGPGPAGGGGGGGLTAGNGASAGGKGGNGYAKGGAPRRSDGGNGGAALAAGAAGPDKAWTRGLGAGGGGGGSGDGAGTVPGGAGGAGGAPGGGGGGGGASTNGAASGAGGPGGRGEVWIICRS